MKNYAMNNDPGIICFQHCASSIFCYSLPQFCPICRRELNDDANVIPFRVPYPFVRGSQTPWSILLKPSTGNFLNCYNVNADLHIGITTSAGKVVEYDFNGLCDHKTDSWSECLCVYTLEDISWREKWDDVLQDVSEKFQSLNDRYDENNFNCYSFVLEFVRCLRHIDFVKSSSSKENFCQNLVIPRMTAACKYVCLYRKLRDVEYFVEK